MPHSCKVTGCQNRKKKGDNSVSFYRIPHKRQRRKLWIAALNMEGLSEEELANVRVCSHHFVHGKSSVFPGHPDYAPSVFNCNQNNTIKNEHHKIDKTHREQNTPQTEADEEEEASVGSMNAGEDGAGVSDDESGSESGNIQRPDDVKMIEIKEEAEETQRDEGQWIGVKALQQLVEVAEEARKMKEAKLMKPPSMADQLKDFATAGSTPTTKPLRQIVPNGISPEDWTTAMANLNVYLVQMYCCKLCENKFGSMSQPVILAHLKEVHQIELNKAQSTTTTETPKRTETTRTKRTPSIQSIRQSVLKSALDEACRESSTTRVPKSHTTCSPEYPTTCSPKTNFPALSFKHGLTIVNKVTQSDINPNINQTTQVQSEGQTTMTYKLGSPVPATSKDDVVVCKHCDERCNSMQEYWAHCHKKHLLTDVSVDD